MLLLLELQERANEGQQALPLLPGHVVDITIGELANGLQEAAGIKGSYIELPVVLSHSPDILIFPVTKARANTRDATFREHRCGISHHQLNILVFVHAVQAHRLPQILIHEIKINVKEYTLQRNLFIVVLTDVQVIPIHHQNASASPGTGGVNAKGIFGAVLPRVTNDGGPAPHATLILIAPDQSKGLHGVLIRHILRSSGTDGYIEAPIEVHHLPNGAAIDAVFIVKSRITEQVLLTGNLGKGLLSIPGVGGGENLRPLFL